MGWTIELADAVLKECQSGGFLSGPLPMTNHATIELAQSWYEEAKKEAEKGVKHSTVLAIVNLVEGQLQEQGNIAIADNEVEESNPGLAAVPMESTYPRRSSGGLSESDEREIDNFPHELEALVVAHHLPVPSEFDGEPSPMPREIDDVGDKQLRRLSGEYNSYLGRAKWLLAVATSDLANAIHLRDRALRKAFKEVHEELVAKDQRPTKDVVTSFAEERDEVVSWNERVKGHQNHVTAYKALVEIYGGNVERLSREATLRQYEWERGR